MKQGKRKGQSTLEYIILVTAIVAVAVIFLRPSSGSKMYDTVEGSYNTVADGVNKMTNKLSNIWK